MPCPCATGPAAYKLNTASVHERGLAPIIFGSVVLVLAIGFLAAFFVALAVVAWFLRWVRRHGFIPFAIYRIMLGLILLFALARGLLGR